jgi:type VI secretion system VasD/TssJ family lipoprotein
MDVARRGFVGLCCTGLAGCTATRQTLSDATGWVAKKLDPAPPPPPPPPTVKAEPPPPPPKPILVVPARQMQLAVQAGNQINPDFLGRPSPVIVRVYLLRAEITFGAADFFSLFERDAATLGADLLAREEIQLRPGRAVSISREFPADARFLGVVVAFRDIERSGWRALSSLPVPPPPMEKPPDQPIKVPVRVAIDGGEIAVSIG